MARMIKNKCLIYTSHKPVGVHPCILVHKHTDILSTAQDMRKLKQTKNQTKIYRFFSCSSPFPVVEINKNFRFWSSLQ